MTQENGVVERIRIFPAKGEAGKELTEGRLIKDRGLEGDYHATGGDRQISLLFIDGLESITDDQKKGLCLSRFRENISVRGIKSAEPGARFSVGEAARKAAGRAALEITGEIKHCHEACSLYEAEKSCPLAGMNLFAKVTGSGIIRVGDSIGIFT